MKVSVDHRKCMGSGRCVDILPEIFFQNEDGLSSMTDDHPPQQYHDLVHAAVAACPGAAIMIEEE